MPWADFEVMGLRGRLEWEGTHVTGDPELLFAVDRFMAGRGTTAELTPDGPVFNRETWRSSPQGFHAAVRTTAQRFRGKVHDSDIGDCIPADPMAGTPAPEEEAA